MTIEAWYREQAPRRKVYNSTPAMVRMPFGILPHGPVLRESDGSTRLAEFWRHGEKPLVRLILPNQLTIGRHRAIRDVVLKEGGTVFSVPTNTIGVAEIEGPTIEVIDTKFSKHAFRADEQLLRAEVQTPKFTRDSWGFQSHSGYNRRTAYFLSGYDRNEPGLSYFFCELPAGVEPTTVKEAYASLKPKSVKLAETQGFKVKRQGDMFFIRMKNWQPDYARLDTLYRNQYLHNSNHIAEEVVWVDGNSLSGLTYVRGRISHAPAGRRPDHGPLDLGKKYWWLCVRNTVPLSKHY